MSNRLLKEGFSKQQLLLDGLIYEIYTKQTVFQNVDAPRLAVISYIPERLTMELLKICIHTIRYYTNIPYELWIIDNNSPLNRVKWLLKEDGINLVFSRTNPKESGSYANAIGLEIATRVIDPRSNYLMTLHQDTAVCKTGWLKYLLSKMDDSTRAVGVRMDTARVKDGILHVLGYLLDFQLFRNLHLSFFPELPDYDVGDKAIIGLKEAGYQIFATPNTLWNEDLIDTLPLDSPFRELKCDKSLDDEGDVFFLHLGRGVLKSKHGRYFNKDHGINMWINFCRNILLENYNNDDPLFLWK